MSTIRTSSSIWWHKLTKIDDNSGFFAVWLNNTQARVHRTFSLNLPMEILLSNIKTEPCENGHLYYHSDDCLSEIFIRKAEKHIKSCLFFFFLLLLHSITYWKHSITYWKHAACIIARQFLTMFPSSCPQLRKPVSRSGDFSCVRAKKTREQVKMKLLKFPSRSRARSRWQGNLKTLVRERASEFHATVQDPGTLTRSRILRSILKILPCL